MSVLSIRNVEKNIHEHVYMDTENKFRNVQ